jgi:hypothetical protein
VYIENVNSRLSLFFYILNQEIMKNLMPLMALALVFLIGCAKEETTPSFLNTDVQQLDKINSFVLNLDGDIPVWQAATLEEVPSTQSNSRPATYRGNGNSAHTHGDFPGVEFSGTQNNGGTHGSATLNLGPWTFTCETECVMIEGNEAVYGGTITDRTGPPPPPGAPFNIGDYAYIKVIDNGQGNNADPDQFYGRIQFFASSKCGDYTPGNTAAWPPTITCCGGLIIPMINNVPEPGSIKVNNF